MEEVQAEVRRKELGKELFPLIASSKSHPSRRRSLPARPAARNPSFQALDAEMKTL
ncbi:hypothetical protein DPMN_175685 [Dreissena polymorpha]|uniref:Uncharacterized protein n=1 Tax=Dreissena polymorpha TaxID=45954 RepID=A0A9D4IG97_DREPO|nr:hypothetical protein DPMN_175685 [Dreissena polymorpha]